MNSETAKELPPQALDQERVNERGIWVVLGLVLIATTGVCWDALMGTRIRNLCKNNCVGNSYGLRRNVLARSSGARPTG